MDRVEELFIKAFQPHECRLIDEEIKFLQEEANEGNLLAELSLILVDFSFSTIHYVPFNDDENFLDDIQIDCFKKLDALGKIFPLAYKVAGEIYLGKMGKITWNKEKALSYFEKYIEVTGDRDFLEDSESYMKERWEEYKEIHDVDKRKRYHKNVPYNVTYSHDPLYYEDLANKDKNK